MQNTSEYKALRRVFDQNFRASVIPKYETHQIRATVRLLENLLSDPSDFLHIIHLYVSIQSFNINSHRNADRRSVGSVILDVVYGYEAKPKNDEWVDLADQVMKDFSDASRCVAQHILKGHV